jgi:hypothetical protein
MLWTLTYDADGHFSQDVVANLIVNIRNTGVRDLVVFSHGWNNGQEQATDLYNRWFDLLRPLLTDATSVGFVGLFWPSQLWRDEPIPDYAPPTADSGGAAALTNAPADNVMTTELEPDIVADLKELFPERAGNLDAVAALLAAPVTPETINELYDEIEAFSRIEPDVDDGESGSAPTLPGMFTDPRTPRETFEDLADALASTGAAVGDPDVGPAGLRDIGARILGGAREALRQASYWRMKQRAGTVGAVGLGRTLQQLGTEFPDLRIHLVGHSFGGRLVSFALNALPEVEVSPVKSVTLLQAAFSRFAFTDRLPFRSGSGALSGRLSRVDGPVAVCFSKHDKALGTFYPIASMLGGTGADAAGAVDPLARWRAMGSHGAYGADVQQLSTTMPRYQLEPGVITNFNAEQIVFKGDSPSGAHSDIFKPELAWLVASAVNPSVAVPAELRTEP